VKQREPAEDKVEFTKISEQGEAFISNAITKLGAMSVSGLASAIIEGKDDVVERMAGNHDSMMGADAGTVARNIELVKQEYTATAKSALARVGVDPSDFETFTSYAWDKHADAVRDACFRQALDRTATASVAPIARATSMARVFLPTRLKTFILVHFGTSGLVTWRYP
jgi:hypothetical protein